MLHLLQKLVVIPALQGLVNQSHHPSVLLPSQAMISCRLSQVLAQHHKAGQLLAAATRLRSLLAVPSCHLTLASPPFVAAHWLLQRSMALPAWTAHLLQRAYGEMGCISKG